MQGQPSLTIILTTHAGAGHVNTLLDKLLSLQSADLDIIFVNDAAESSRTQTAKEILDHYPGQNLTWIDHEIASGRSNSLNKAVEAAKGSFIWAPLKADRLNGDLLKDFVRKMKTDPASFWILDRSLPADTEEWISEAAAGTLPSDERFVFNREVIPPSKFFFRDNTGIYTAAEMAYRIYQTKPWQRMDAFFIVDRSRQPLPEPVIVQEFIFTMMRQTTDAEERERLAGELLRLDFTLQNREDDLSGLDKIRSVAEQDARRALELADEYLSIRPDHTEATKLKITLLEKLRRHVEAAELKHELIQKKDQIREKSESAEKTSLQPTLFSSVNLEGGGSDDTMEPHPSAVQEKDAVFEDSSRQNGPGCLLSIIIPTTGNGRPYLEECLLRIDQQCDPGTTELIVIDNASIDDTFDYLCQLKERDFLNIQIITNPQNAGFGTSVNQGIDAASGERLLVMHNDLVLREGAIHEMQSVLDHNLHIGAVGPAVDQCDTAAQLHDHLPKEIAEDFIRMDSLDSCCIMFRKSTGVKFSEVYGLAFYETADFCNTLAERGYYMAAAVHARADHHYRVTTDAMGLNLEPELRLENADIFHARWNLGPDLQFPEGSDIEELLGTIPLPLNPLNPSGYWLDQIETLFSDEVKTDILKRSFSSEHLFIMIRLLLIADKRDFLRQIESRVIDQDIPDDLLKELIRYYYRRNIFSRCRMYLDKPEATGAYYDFYRLRISVKEKEEDSIPLLNELMEKFPCHPDLYRIAGELHLMNGNEGEAKSFFALANQLKPEKNSHQQVFEIKY